jgi:hypothetical protein
MKTHILIILFLFPLYCFSDTLYVPRGEWIENNSIAFKWENISIETDFRFQGYLIIQFCDITIFTDTINNLPFPLPFKIFWIRNLADLHDTSKYIWYFYNLGHIVQSVYYNKDLNADEYNFCKYYVIFYKNLSWNCLPPIYDVLNSNIYTTILDSINIWEKNGQYFAISNCFFYGSKIISVSQSYKSVTGSDTLYTLLPVSHYFQFNEILEQEAILNGFKKLNIDIITYNRK